MELAAERTPPLEKMVGCLLAAMCPLVSPSVTFPLARGMASQRLGISFWQKPWQPNSCCQLWGRRCLWWMMPRPLLVVMVDETTTHRWRRKPAAEDCAESSAFWKGMAWCFCRCLKWMAPELPLADKPTPVCQWTVEELVVERWDSQIAPTSLASVEEVVAPVGLASLDRGEVLDGYPEVVHIGCR